MSQTTAVFTSSSFWWFCHRRAKRGMR